MTVLCDHCLVECVDFNRGLKDSYSKVVFYLREKKISTFYFGNLPVIGKFKFDISTCTVVHLYLYMYLVNSFHKYMYMYVVVPLLTCSNDHWPMMCLYS